MQPRLALLGLVLICSNCADRVGFKYDASRFPLERISQTTFGKGEPTIPDGPFAYASRAEEDLQQVSGVWRPSGAVQYFGTRTYYGEPKTRSWMIQIYRRANDRVASSIRTAENGYQAKLGKTINASARIYPRFERKRFRWGEAVSFLVQYQNDNTNFVPNNGMLQYEVHGLTDHGRYIRASFGVTHPDLVEFGPGVRSHRDSETGNPSRGMREDPHYQLVETAAADEFQPSLAEIDALLDTLEIN